MILYGERSQSIGSFVGRIAAVACMIMQVNTLKSLGFLFALRVITKGFSAKTNCRGA